MIPKTIHYCWFGHGSKPRLMEKCIRSWQKYCPDYEIVEWNESNYDITKNPYMQEAYEAKKWGFVPDFARLDIIYRYGGIYMDTDVEIVRPIDGLLSLKGFAGFETPEFVNFGQGFAAEAGNPVIKALLDSYDGLHFRKEDGTLDMLPSPQLNTPVLCQLGLKADGTLQELDGFRVYPTDYFCPLDWGPKKLHKTPNTYSIHWFSASWFDEQAKREDRLRPYKLARRRICTRLIGEENYEKLKKLIKG